MSQVVSPPRDPSGYLAALARKKQHSQFISCALRVSLNSGLEWRSLTVKQASFKPGPMRRRTALDDLGYAHLVRLHVGGIERDAEPVIRLHRPTDRQKLLINHLGLAVQR